ncbi:C2H2 type zinc finger domain-containing protein [Periconia macrospinosa]|uniref:C2H2 type zinc finger domain-containing protein n=1 Tax=Periconia macrospinosa TaxID=97972 RepID=A0A2V1DKW5_9PLEO|nr:C2H2 type zinc finger domain-containing protein [Periconia macrospinosa]
MANSPLSEDLKPLRPPPLIIPIPTPTSSAILLPSLMAMQDDEFQANTRTSKRQRVTDGDTNSKGTLQCQVCYRSYDRADHLNRHLDSHATVTFPTPPDNPSLTQPSLDADPQGANQFCVDSFPNIVNPDAQALLNLCSDGYYQPPGIPSFFEQIMVSEPDFIAMETSQAPLDLMTWMPDIDGLGEGDLFGTDFAPTIDQTFEAQRVLDGFFVGPKDPISKESLESAQLQNRQDAARMRHAIFQRSPWLWVPSENQHTFSEDDKIILDERNVDLASSPHEPSAATLSIADRLSPQARDRVFQLVSKTAQSQISIPSFPSADCLDRLIKVGIAKRTETDAWIHPYSFESETARPEFLTALIAAGCVCFGIPSVSRTGLVLQEIVRVALGRLTEHDNSTIRDLQYLQASMLWLDIAAFCGFKRKMEIAESSLQPLVTALRRAGKLDKVSYVTTAPAAHDSEDILEKKWHSWVEHESYKRLVYHLFEHDIKMTQVKSRNPLTSYAELTLPLPASRALWLAPSAEAWRTRLLNTETKDASTSLRTLLQDDSAVKCLPPSIDIPIARSAYLHGLAAQIWEHSKQSALFENGTDASSQLWLQSRQQKLEQCLQNTDFTIENSPAIACVFHQFLKVSLNVDLDTITRFAGKCGEEEAHHAYTQLQTWSSSKKARTAVWHAGQLLRSARSIPPYQIRGADSFMIYHAVMVIWTYSMMLRDRAIKTGLNTPAHANVEAVQKEKTPIIFLDDQPDSNQETANAFILTGSGVPCLRIVSDHSQSLGSPERHEICSVKIPSQVMRVGVKLLEACHPNVPREKGPPLSQALCRLMEELGGLR